MSSRVATRRTPLAPTILIGTDIIEIDRVAESVARFGERYIARLYTRDEATYCTNAGADPAPYFATRFAAKEAAMKVLRPAPNEGLDWRSIEVVRSAEGWCDLRLYGMAQTLARRAGLRALAVSVSHAELYATAVVVAERAPRRTTRTARVRRSGERAARR
jgi:holo-[acyl-carrier protein] synthase